MGTFAAYTFESGIYLLAGYLIYKWLLSAENQPAFNRLILLSIYAIAFMAPLLRVPGFANIGGVNPAAIVEAADIAVEVLPGTVPEWVRPCIVLYYAGIIVATLFTIISFIRLFAILRKGETHKTDSYSLILLRDTKFATFSWLRYIVMSRQDYEEGGDTILLHERAHIRLHHWIDLMLSQLVIILLWYNPASWLMRSELRNVHEYQADDAVLKSGADARQYQLLLTKKAVGQRFPSLANSLNHSKLKNRITMMCKQKSSPTRRLRVLAIAPALLIAAVAVNNPSVASAIGAASSVSLSEGKDNEKNPEAQIPSALGTFVQQQPDVMPEYPGGMPEMFKFLATNVNYPSAAANKGDQGRVVVRFIVNPSGKVIDLSVIKSVSPELDAEAIRVASIMPDWTPAMKDGSPVSCAMVLPVNFKLQKEDTQTMVLTVQDADKGIYAVPVIDPLVVVGYGSSN